MGMIKMLVTKKCNKKIVISDHITYRDVGLCLSEGLEDKGSEPSGARVISIAEGAVGSVASSVQELPLVS